MAVRAKFKVQRIESTQYQKARRKEDGQLDYQDVQTVEMRTVVMSPVYHNGDPTHENTRFWDASPSGEIKLGTINPQAWEAFELGREYYIDFTPAD